MRNEQIIDILHGNGFTDAVVDSNTNLVTIPASGRDWNDMNQMLWDISFLEEFKDWRTGGDPSIDIDMDVFTNTIYIGDADTVYGIVEEPYEDYMSEDEPYECEQDDLQFCESVKENKRRALRKQLRLKEGALEIYDAGLNNDTKPFDYIGPKQYVHGDDCSDLFCSRCGEEISYEDEVCPSCGFNLVSEYCENGYDERTYDPFTGLDDIDVADENEVYDDIYAEDVFECRNAVDYKNRSIKDPTGTKHINESSKNKSKGKARRV